MYLYLLVCQVAKLQVRASVSVDNRKAEQGVKVFISLTYLQLSVV